MRITRIHHFKSITTLNSSSISFSFPSSFYCLSFSIILEQKKKTKNDKRQCKTITTKKKSFQDRSMLFSFALIPMVNSGSFSSVRLEHILICLLLICCTLTKLSNAYPHPLTSMDNNENNHHRYRRWTMSNENTLNPKRKFDRFLERRARSIGYHIVFDGIRLILIPDSKHNPTKNIRHYIGGRR